MATRLQLWIPGDPAAQGSKAYMGHRPSKKSGKLVPLLVEQSKAVTPWRNAVRGAASQHLFSEYLGAWKPLDGPVAVEVTFLLPRPSTVTRALPTVPPDLDKLQRALFDGLSDAKLWKDDSRAVLVAASKIYATAPAHPPIKYQSPGAAVTITALPDDTASYSGLTALAELSATVGDDLPAWLDAVAALAASGLTPWQTRVLAQAVPAPHPTPSTGD